MEIQTPNPTNAQPTHSPSFSCASADPLGHQSINSLASEKASSSAKDAPGFLAKAWDCVMYIPRLIGSAISWAYNSIVHLVKCCPAETQPPASSVPAQPVIPPVLSFIEQSPSKFIEDLGTDPNASVKQLINAFAATPKQFSLFFQNKKDILQDISQAIPQGHKNQLAQVLRRFNNVASADISKGLIPSLRMFANHCAEKAKKAPPLPERQAEVAKTIEYFEVTFPALLTTWEENTAELATFWMGDEESDGVQGIRTVLTENGNLSLAFDDFIAQKGNPGGEVLNLFHHPHNLFQKGTFDLQYDVLNKKLLENLVLNTGPSVCTAMLETFDETTPISRHFLTSMLPRFQSAEFCKEFALYFPQICGQLAALAQ